MVNANRRLDTAMPAPRQRWPTTALPQRAPSRGPVAGANPDPPRTDAPPTANPATRPGRR
jgi:hypothetical protein